MSGLAGRKTNLALRVLYLVGRPTVPVCPGLEVPHSRKASILGKPGQLSPFSSTPYCWELRQATQPLCAFLCILTLGTIAVP